MERLTEAWLYRLDQYEELDVLTLKTVLIVLVQGALDLRMSCLRLILAARMSVLLTCGHVLRPRYSQGFHPRCTRSLLCSMKNVGWNDSDWLTTAVVSRYITKIYILKSIPNPRKISISPWADPEEAAERIGDNYVLSLKPSPASLAAED